MEAGDGMIFPVDLYHGVKPIGENNSKYYIRQFMTHNRYKEIEDSKIKFLAGGKTEEEFEHLLEDSRKQAFATRKNPVLFNSIEDIDIDPSLNQVACIIGSHRILGV
jgi:hypothetical protein